MKSKFLRTLAPSLFFCASSQAATITSISSNEWDVAATWDSNAPAPVTGTQGTGDDYVVASTFTVTSNDPASNSQALVGQSLAVQSGGVLDLARLHANTAQAVTWNLPPVTLEDGAELQFRSSTGTSNHTLAANISVSGNTTIDNTGGAFGQDISLTGALSGSGTINYKTANSGSATTVRTLALKTAASPFAGNWFIQHANSGDDFGALSADASGALGTGTVTLDTRARLINTVTGGFDGLGGITLGQSTSSIYFNGRDWTSATGALTVNNGNANVGTAHLNIASVSQTGGSINLTVGGAKSGRINVSGEADFYLGEITLNYAGNPVGKTFDLVTYGTLLELGEPEINLGGIGNHIVATVDYGSGTNDKVTVSFTGSAANLTWLGNEPGFESDWDNNVAINWDNGGTPDVFSAFDHVTFGNTTGSTTPNVIGALLPGSVTFDHSDNDYTLGGTGSIGGLGTLAKSGAGTLTITTNNSYTGGTTLNDGRIRIGHNNALGTGSLTVNGGSISSNGATARTLAMPVTLNAPLTLGHATDTGDLTFNGVIDDGAGSSALTKQGSGTLTLSAANTYDGGTTLSAGKIRVGSNTSLGTGALAIGGGALTSNGTAARTLANPVTIGGGFTLGNATDTGAVNLSGPVTLAGNATVTAESATNMEVSGAIGGSGNVEYKRATGPQAQWNWTNAANNFTGDITVTAGRLRFNPATDGSALGNASNKIIFNGEPVVTGPGTASIQQSSGAGTTIPATREVVLNTGKEGTFFTWGGQTFTVNAPINGGGALRKEDGGTLVLTGNNTFGGGLVIDNGIAIASSDTALGTGPVTVGNTTTGGQTHQLQLNGVTISNDVHSRYIYTADYRGTVTAVGGVVSTIAGDVTIHPILDGATSRGGHLASDATVGSVLRLLGELNVAGGATDISHRDGVVEYGGGSSTSYTLGITNTARLVADNGIGSGVSVMLGQSANATLDLNGYDLTIARLLRNANTTTVTNTAATASVLTIDGATDHTYSGAIANGTGGIAFVKKGASNVTFSGTLSYQGDTTVEGGTLTLTGGNARFADLSAVRITTGATLNLTHGAADTVDKLFVNGVQQPANTYNSGNSAFITGTGSLVVTTGPAGDDYSIWAATHAGSQSADLDFDNDGVPNGVEYFMGVTTPGFTANPPIINGKVTWPMSPTFVGSYEVKTSPDLVNWTPAPGGVVETTGVSVEYTLPTGDPKRFVRLEVTVP